MAEFYFLNNSGSRWKVPGYKIRVIGPNYNKVRTVEFLEAFGNFVTVNFRINGKRISGFVEDFERDAEGLPILRIKE